MKQRNEKKRIELRYVAADMEEWKENGEFLPGAEELAADLKCHGIRIVKPEPVCLKQLAAEEALLISEKKSLLHQAEKLGMAAVQLELPRLVEHSQTDGDAPDEVSRNGEEAECITLPVAFQSLEGIDFDWLNRIWQRKQNIPWRILNTKRCYLEELSLEDLDELYEIYEAPGMTAYVEPLYDREKEEEYERAYIKNMYGFFGYGMWLVREKETDKLIGRAGLENHEYDGEWELEIGYLIAVPYQRQGYAYEVCRAVIEYAREYLEYDSINCRIEPDNKASVTLAKKLGFQRIGTLEEDGHCYDRYRLTLEERV